MKKDDYIEMANDRETSISMWQELASSEIQDSFRSAICELFIPYNISAIKYMINHDATSDPFRYIMYEKEPLFSKTLKRFQEKPSLKAPFFPNWFYCAFPDVAYWAIKGPGKYLIEVMFQNYTEDDLFSNNKIKLVYLKLFVFYYTRTIRKPLEVGI